MLDALRRGDMVEFHRAQVDFYDVLAARAPTFERREQLEDRAVEAEWLLDASKRELAYRRDSARCRAMAGKSFEPGVPLHLYRKDRANVLLICDACNLTRAFPLEDVIQRLKERGVGDENTGIRSVALHTRGPCPRCGKREWQTRPQFPPIPGQNGVRGE